MTGIERWSGVVVLMGILGAAPATAQPASPEARPVERAERLEAAVGRLVGEDDVQGEQERAGVLAAYELRDLPQLGHGRPHAFS